MVASVSRRQLLVSLVVIWVAAAGAGAGTMAYFSDQETSRNNQVGLGTLDLVFDGTNGEATTAFSVPGVAPGASGDVATTLSNEGSADGVLDLTIGPGENLEGANTEAEGDTSGAGELGGQLLLTVHLSETKDPENDPESVVVAEGTFNAINDTTYDENYPLNGDETVYLVIEYELPRDVGNAVQGDEVRVDLTATLDQVDATSSTNGGTAW